MSKSTQFNRYKNKSLCFMKPAGNLFLALLFVCSLFLTACSKSSSPVVVPTKPTTQTATEAPAKSPSESATDKPVLGVIKVKGGSMLERDIIPQLSTVFSLPEQKVKDTLAAASTSSLINKELTDFRRMEGMIPPGDYVIYKGTTLEEEVSLWVSESEKRYSKLLSSTSSPNNLTPVKQLSLASMVEAECLSVKHQEEVATVFLNRLDKGSKLQSCATAEYANGYQRPYLTLEDTTKVSNYNTYYVSGLPIGPICTISDASLQAAINKKMDSPIYYFYYDYILNDIFFYSDYSKFKKEGDISRKLFEEKSTVDKRAKINKQELYH